MRLMKLAARNLLRNLRRTGITLTAIALGLAIMVFIINLQYGRYGSWIDAGISAQAGHVVIQADGYQEQRKARMVVEDAGAITAQLQADHPDAVVAPRIFLGGTLQSTHGAASVALTGLEPDAERRVQELHDKVIEGDWLGDDDREVVIGEELAKALKAELGDKLVFLCQSGTEQVQSRLFRVRGVFRTGAASIDGRVAYAHLAAAQELLGRGDAVNMVTLHLADAERAFEAAPHIEAQLARPELDVRDWKEALPDVFAMIAMDQAACDGSLFMVALLVGFGVLNTILMSTLERTREFGVMMALGMKPRRIAGLVLLEATLLGLVGAVLGLAIGAAMTWPAVQHGIDYGEIMGGPTMEQGGVVVSTLFYAAWYPLRMITYSLSMVAFCVLAAIYPAWSISKLRPTQALRHN